MKSGLSSARASRTIPAVGFESQSRLETGQRFGRFCSGHSGCRCRHVGLLFQAGCMPIGPHAVAKGSARGRAPEARAFPQGRDSCSGKGGASGASLSSFRHRNSRCPDPPSRRGRGSGWRGIRAPEWGTEGAPACSASIRGRGTAGRRGTMWCGRVLPRRRRSGWTRCGSRR